VINTTQKFGHIFKLTTPGILPPTEDTSYVLHNDPSHYDGFAAQCIAATDRALGITYSHTPPTAKASFYQDIQPVLRLFSQPPAHRNETLSTLKNLKPTAKTFLKILGHDLDVLMQQATANDLNPTLISRALLNAAKASHQLWEGSEQSIRKQLRNHPSRLPGFSNQITETYASQHPERVTNLDTTA
jgi:hypothetical protein